MRPQGLCLKVNMNISISISISISINSYISISISYHINITISIDISISISFKVFSLSRPTLSKCKSEVRQQEVRVSSAAKKTPWCVGWNDGLDPCEPTIVHAMATSAIDRRAPIIS